VFAFVTPIGIFLVVLMVFGIVAGGFFLGKSLRNVSRNAPSPNELAELREDFAELSDEVAELREEMERLKRLLDSSGSTGIKEL